MTLRARIGDETDEGTDLDPWAEDDGWHEDDEPDTWSPPTRARGTDPRAWLGDDEDDDLDW